MVSQGLVKTGVNLNNGFSPTLKAVARKVLPVGMWRAFQRAANNAGEWREAVHLARLRHRMSSNLLGSDQPQRLLHYTIRINDGRNFYALYKDIFIRRIYHFEARRPDPLILDCGSNIGGTILYFKYVYPQARIIGFEPDPAIFSYLQQNIAHNGLTGVQLVQAALAGREGTYAFYSDGASGSRLEEVPREKSRTWTKYEVPCIRLRDYLTEPVDFLKMNIEGAEWEVLADSESHLEQVREMVIEYHHFANMRNTLHKILELLQRRGFDYLINHFDYETNPGLRPPFKMTRMNYYLLIYAMKVRQSDS